MIGLHMLQKSRVIIVIIGLSYTVITGFNILLYIHMQRNTDQ